MLLSKTSLSEKATYHRIQTKWRYGKDNTMQTIERFWGLWSGMGEGKRAEHKGFVGQWKSSVWSWWIHVTLHLFKPIECTTLRENSNIYCGLCDFDVTVGSFYIKYTIPVIDVGIWAGYACVGT